MTVIVARRPSCFALIPQSFDFIPPTSAKRFFFLLFSCQAVSQEFAPGYTVAGAGVAPVAARASLTGRDSKVTHFLWD